MLDMVFALAVSAANIDTACLAVGPERGNQITLVAKTENAPQLIAKGARPMECPGEMEWSVESAQRTCGVYFRYSPLAQLHFEELYGFTTKEICAESREAAGLERETKRE